MKRLLILLALIFISPAKVYAAANQDFSTLYSQTPMSTVKLMHDIDPYQDEEYHKYAWSPYPLFRTCTDLYFKDISIPAGYYLLTARNFKGVDYVLFKACGKVVYIVPVAKKTETPLDFYTHEVPRPKQTKMQKLKSRVKDAFLGSRKDSKRMPPPKSFIDIADDGVYILVRYYYGNDCYWLVFKKTKY